MAKARIVYVVDDKELKQTQKELEKLKKKGSETTKKFNEDWGFVGDEVEKTNKELGKTEKELKKTKGGLVDLKGTLAGLGIAGLVVAGIKAFADLSSEINKSRKEVALLTKETGITLDNITAKIRATSKVFDKDFTEVLRAANAAGQQFGISMTMALDEINEGFTRGLDINGEYLETIREYTPFMEKAGISFRQFNVLIQKQVTEGIFSDKGIDSIKEAQISLEEMTPAVQDALKAIGISADQVTKDIKSGARTYFEVIQEIGKATREALDPRVTGQIKADIFRGAGEDAGDYSITLDQVGDSFEDVTEEQQKYIDAQTELLVATENTEKELLKLTLGTQSLGTSLATFWEKVKSGTVGGLNDLIEAFTSAEKQMENFRRGVAGADKASLQAAIDELNVELEKSEKLLKFHESQTHKNTVVISAWKEEVKKLNTQITEAENKIVELDRAEIDEAAAAKKAKEESEALAIAKQEQVKAFEAAEKAAKEEAKALEKSAERAKRLKEIESGEGIEGKDPFEDKKSEFLKEAEAKAEGDELIKKQEQKLQDDLLEIKEEAREKDKEAEDLKIEEAKERREQRIQFIFDTLNQVADIQAQFSDRRIEQINLELSALELSRNRELELAEGNAQQEADINAKFDAKKKVLLKKQLNEEKKQALFGIAINTAQAIVKGIAQFGPPPSPLGIAAIAAAAAIGLLQGGLVLSQKVPEFAEGVLRFRGKGTRKSDSNLVKISDEETILSAQTTDDYYPAIKAIYNREISPDVLNNLVMHRDTQPNITINDYDKLAMAVRNQTQKSINVDVNGFTEHIVKTGISIQKKQAKYKM